MPMPEGFYTSKVLSVSKLVAPGQTVIVETTDQNGHFAKATLGGLIRVNERYYLMTAAHPFRTLRPAVNPAEVVEEANLLSYSYSDDEPAGQDLQSKSDEAKGSDGNFKGKEPMPGDPYSMYEEAEMVEATQPNNNTFEIGTLWFSSIEQTLPELDYALVALNADAESDLLETNTQQLEWQSVIIDSSIVTLPNHIGKEELKDVQEVFIAWPEERWPKPNQPSMIGMMDTTPVSLRMPGTKGYQEVYEVKFAEALSVGDCGSWVICNNSNLLIGHIIAGSPEDGLVYIVPFYQVFQDLRRFLASTSQASDVPLAPPWDPIGFVGRESDYERGRHQEEDVD